MEITWIEIAKEVLNFDAEKFIAETQDRVTQCLYEALVNLYAGKTKEAIEYVREAFTIYTKLPLACCFAVFELTEERGAGGKRKGGEKR